LANPYVKKRAAALALHAPTAGLSFPPTLCIKSAANAPQEILLFLARGPIDEA
jgi:hypothetical protein